MSFYSVELPYQSDAVRYYAALADLPWAVWLDSGGMGGYDILTAVPQRTLVLHEEPTRSDPFALLRKELGEQIAPIADVPFAGGALGYWGYDLARKMYGWAFVLDHQQGSARLLSHQRFAETAELLPQILLRLQRDAIIPQDTFRAQGKITSNFTPGSYASAFAAVQNYLQAGDCYQINLAQRFSAAATGDALGAYLT